MLTTSFGSRSPVTNNATQKRTEYIESEAGQRPAPTEPEHHKQNTRLSDNYIFNKRASRIND